MGIPQNVPIVNKEAYSAADLLLSGYHVESVILSLLNVDFTIPGLQTNKLGLNCHLPMSVLPQKEVYGTVKAHNVSLIEVGSSLWLDCDDVTFMSIAGTCSGLAIGLQFEQGMGEPLVAFLTDDRYFFGLPITPNGGSVHLTVPSPGLLRIS